MVGNAQDIASDTCQKRCLSGTSVGELHQHRTGNIMCGRVDLRPVNHYIVKASVLASLHTVTAPLRSFETQLSRPPCFQIWPPLVSPPCSYVKSFLGQDLERLAAYGPRPVAAAGSSEAEAVAALSVSLSGWSPMGQQPASLSSHPPQVCAQFWEGSGLLERVILHVCNKRMLMCGSMPETSCRTT